MHISTPQASLLTNHEVYLHLLTEEAEYTGTESTFRSRKKPSGLNHVLRDGLAYFRSEAVATPLLVEKHPNRPLTLYRGPHSLFRALAPKYRLNKAEYLQLYNLRPTTQVMLELVIEEAGTRFTEEELHDILAIVKQVFEEDEASIPAGVERMDMPKITNKLLGANKKRRKAKKKTTT